MTRMHIDRAIHWTTQGHHRIWLVVLSLLWILLAGFVHFLTGPQYEFHLVFLLPVIVVSWFVSLQAEGLTTLFSAIVWMVADWPHATDLKVLLLNEAVRLSVFCLVSVMVARLRSAFERESGLARVDALTQLPNSRNFHEIAGAEIARARRYGHQLTLISLDLDNFKSVNDLDGHDAGDRVLRSVGETLRENIRSMDVPGQSHECHRSEHLKLWFTIKTLQGGCSQPHDLCSFLSFWRYPWRRKAGCAWVTYLSAFGTCDKQRR